MASAVKPMDEEIANAVVLLRQMVRLMNQQNACDSGNRQRVTLDAITAGTVLPTVTAVTTVTTVTTVTNLGSIAGEGIRQFEIPARNCYANAIRNKLTFG
jgi:hypothetical protein